LRLRRPDNQAGCPGHPALDALKKSLLHQAFSGQL
jgi:hypothetical protein